MVLLACRAGRGPRNRFQQTMDYLYRMREANGVAASCKQFLQPFDEPEGRADVDKPIFHGLLHGGDA